MKQRWLAILTALLALCCAVYSAAWAEAGDAAALLEKAQQGDPKAQNDLALCYYAGDGVKKMNRKRCAGSWRQRSRGSMWRS